MMISCVQLAILNFNVKHYKHTLQKDSFMQALLVGTIDFYYCALLSVTLILPGHHKVSTSKTSWIHVFPHFSAIRMNFNMVLKQFKLNFQILALNEN